MADPDLQKSGGGPGHPDPEIRGRWWGEGGGGVVLGAGLTKKFFRPFGPQFKGVPPLLSLSPRFFWEQKYVRECLIKILSHYFYLHLNLFL